MSGGTRSGSEGKAGPAGAKAPSPRPLRQRGAVPPARSGESAEAAPLRRFDCTHYDACLDEAVRQGWPSWTCDGCEAYLAAPVERLAHDVAGLLQIWSEATGESVIDGPGVSGARPRHSARGVPR